MRTCCYCCKVCLSLLADLRLQRANRLQAYCCYTRRPMKGTNCTKHLLYFFTVSLRSVQLLMVRSHRLQVAEQLYISAACEGGKNNLSLLFQASQDHNACCDDFTDSSQQWRVFYNKHFGLVTLWPHR